MQKDIFVFFNKLNIILYTFYYKFLYIELYFFLKKKFFDLFLFYVKEKIFLILKNNKKKTKKKISKAGRLKEVKLNLNIHIKDFKLKLKKTISFLNERYTVKISVFLKGREIIFKEKGIELLLKFQNSIKNIIFKFSNIEFEGKQIYLILIPNVKK